MLVDIVGVVEGAQVSDRQLQGNAVIRIGQRHERSVAGDLNPHLPLVDVGATDS